MLWAIWPKKWHVHCRAMCNCDGSWVQRDADIFGCMRMILCAHPRPLKPHMWKLHMFEIILSAIGPTCFIAVRVERKNLYYVRFASVFAVPIHTATTQAYTRDNDDPNDHAHTGHIIIGDNSEHYIRHSASCSRSWLYILFAQRFLRGQLANSIIHIIDFP